MISSHGSQQKFKSAGSYRDNFSEVCPKDVKEFCDVVTSKVWSPIVWKDGIRLQGNFIYSHFLALDFDDGPSIEEIYSSFQDTRHIIATTKSHRKVKGEKPACDRFRLVVPFERPIFDLKEYRYNMYVLTKKYGADTAAKDGARFFYPCVKVVSWLKGDGLEMQPVLEAPGWFEKPQNTIVDRCRDISPVPLKRAFLKRYESGNRNNATYGVCKDLMALGYGKDKIFSLVSGWIGELDVSLHLPQEEVELLLHHLYKKSR